MAKATGLLKLQGTIDDITFRKTENGIVAGRKPGPTREKVLEHEHFRRTRLNAGEFQLAIQEATLLRHALGTALQGKTGSSMNGRMNGLFYAAALHDGVNDFGCRRASQGDTGLLRGFDFNKRLLLQYALPVALTHELDGKTGICRVEIPCFIARKRREFPEEATHFRIVSGAAMIDFLRGHYQRDVQRSALLPLRKKTPGGLCFEHRLEPDEGKVMVQVLGVEFYKLENGKEVLIKGSAVRILEAVRVEGEAMGTSTQLHKAGLHTSASEERVEEGNEGRETRSEDLPAARIEVGLQELRIRVEEISKEGIRHKGSERQDPAFSTLNSICLMASKMYGCNEAMLLFPEVVLLE